MSDLAIYATIERRSAERIATDITGGVRPQGKNLNPVKVINLSASGCLVTIKGPISQGAFVWVRLRSAR